MENNVPTVTEAELISHGFRPNCILGSPRTPGRPVSLRYGDNLIQREQSGAIFVHFGHYSQTAELARKVFAKKLAEDLGKLLPSVEPLA